MNAYYFAATITLLVTAILAIPLRDWRAMIPRRQPTIPTCRRFAVLCRDMPAAKRHKAKASSTT